MKNPKELELIRAEVGGIANDLMSLHKSCRRLLKQVRFPPQAIALGRPVDLESSVCMALDQAVDELGPIAGMLARISKDSMDSINKAYIQIPPALLTPANQPLQSSDIMTYKLQLRAMSMMLRSRAQPMPETVWGGGADPTEQELYEAALHVAARVLNGAIDLLGMAVLAGNEIEHKGTVLWDHLERFMPVPEDFLPEEYCKTKQAALFEPE